MARTVAIIQARMGSSRLPGKVMLELAGRPMLARVVERVSRAKRVDEVCVATTNNAEDSVIATLCATMGWKVFRGSELDVLDRYHSAARFTRADRVIRVTSDCPLIDPDVIDLVVEQLHNDVQYCSNVIPIRTYPRGLDTEAFTFGALAAAWSEAESLSDREHVTPFIWRQAERFKQVNQRSPVDYSALRWTVDTSEDYRLLTEIFKYFGDGNFTWIDVLRVVAEHPDWLEMNADIVQKKI